MALLTVLPAAAPAVAAPQPVVIEFEKQWAAPDYYVGTTADGGSIQMWLFDKSVIGNTQHFSATVAVTSPGGSFTAAVSGQFNFSTGRVVLTGTVTSGWLTGARVLEESLLVDPNVGAFVGTLQIMPARS